MSQTEPVRWGVLSTGRIGAGNFLPSLRAAGGGTARAVASRSLDKAEVFARKNGVERAVEGYEALLAADDIDAVYISLPNGLHAEWAIAALRTGKVVLCEKPLSCSLAEAEQILSAVQETGGLLWEAFVFPFHEQTRRLLEVLDSGQIGDVGEIRTVFNFQLSNPTDVRWDPDLAGGALNDVGCYCIHLGTILLREAPARALAMWTLTERGVDMTTQAILEYPSGRRLTFSCSFGLEGDVGATICGTRGLVRVSNPFHARAGDTVEIEIGDQTRHEAYPSAGPTFTDAIRHIHAVVAGEEQPRHLAVTDALPTAKAMELVRRSAG